MNKEKRVEHNKKRIQAAKKMLNENPNGRYSDMAKRTKERLEKENIELESN